MRRALVIAVSVWREMLRRKDIYILGILLLALLFSLVSVNVFNLGTTVRYVMDLGLMMTWLFSIILAVGVGCRQLPDEERRGTIYLLLSKPVTRGEILVGKWLGSWGIVSGATAVFYILVSGVASARGGSFDWVTLSQAWLLHIIAISWVVALGIALSTRLTHGAASALTYVVVASSLLVIPRVPEIIAGAGGLSSALMLIIYYLFPHIELFDMRMRVVHEWGIVPSGIGTLLIAYGVVLTILFIFLAWLGYRGKHFSRGQVL